MIYTWPHEDKLLAMSRAKLSKELPLKLGCLSSASSDVKSKIKEQMLAAIITTDGSLVLSVKKKGSTNRFYRSTRIRHSET